VFYIFDIKLVINRYWKFQANILNFCTTKKTTTAQKMYIKKITLNGTSQQQQQQP